MTTSFNWKGQSNNERRVRGKQEHFLVVSDGDRSVSQQPSFYSETPRCFAWALSVNRPDLNKRRGQFVDLLEGLPSLAESIDL